MEKTEENETIIEKKDVTNLVKRVAKYCYKQYCLFYIHIIIMMSGRIPDHVDDFINYAKQNLIYMQEVDPVTLVANGIRLGVDTATQALFAPMLSELDNTDPNKPGIIQLRADPLTKGPFSRKLYDAYEIKFNNFYHPVLKVVAASPNLTAKDREITHIAEVPETHHADLTPIAEKPVIEVAVAAAGIITLTIHSDIEKKRALPPNSDKVEVTYVVVAPPLMSTELSGKVRETAPTNADECSYKEFNTKTKFNLEVGGKYSGYMLHGFARYINSKRKSVAGLWSPAFSIRVP